MKLCDDAAKYFCMAFQVEIKSRGRGIQKELSVQTGVSEGLICDLKKGRTKGSVEKHRLLAEALGSDYDDFIVKGRQLEQEKLGPQTAAGCTDKEMWEEKYHLAQKVIAAQDKMIAEMDENKRLRLEIEVLKRLGRDLEVLDGLHNPSVGDARNVPAIEAE